MTDLHFCKKKINLQLTY